MSKAVDTDQPRHGTESGWDWGQGGVVKREGDGLKELGVQKWLVTLQYSIMLNPLDKLMITQ